MTEEMVTIVKVKGKGAGSETMTQVLRTTWEKMKSDAAKMTKGDNPKSTFPDALEWKEVIPKSRAELQREEAKAPVVQSSEEIMVEALAKTGTSEATADAKK